MDPDNDLTVGGGTAGPSPYGRPDGAPRSTARPWVNWGLALATVPGAALVMLFALGAVMSTDGCSGHGCPYLGHDGINLGVAFYGAPAVAVLVIIVSFFTAKRRWGVAVPLCGWALLIADVALMAASVAG
ncbi:hypothetical protein [Mycobacterium arosiense]|uniref:Uncharacterized protein n=1 Tax=Mycobacterium arosiense ATCC BAA-1401 = DSM 45069 TaxID=1265311 RepID=A0A1W9ZLN9_MYCAI|nr:hypothetical protein [Mycobacterium arosiense]ORA18027.1 hypothetical protein BST14_07780 [Mycobacterium arosiense ATCC BAA-1401 = DSM 45069]